MSASNKQPKGSQKSIKELTTYSLKSNKQPNSSTSPLEEKDLKKSRLKSTVSNPPYSATMESEITYTQRHEQEQPTRDAKLEGALDPLVQQIKLLHESFDDIYLFLDEKYTRLKAVITSQKHEVASEIGKLQESISSKKQELLSTIEKKIKHTNQGLEQVLKENTSLRKVNVELQDHLTQKELN